MAGEDTIYSDEQKTIINADLFSPPIARKIRVRNAKIMERNFAVTIHREEKAVAFISLTFADLKFFFSSTLMGF